MKSILRIVTLVFVCLVFRAAYAGDVPKADREMIAKIREEGFQRSQIVDTVSYMTDVLGARLTNSMDMKRAQKWAKNKMEEIGLENVVIEPFMDYGVSWDNLYCSLHMIEPDYQPMMGYPLTHTPGTEGKIVCDTVIAEINTKKDLDKYRGKLKGKAVLSTPPARINLDRLVHGTPRRTRQELRELEEDVTPPSRQYREPSTPSKPETPTKPETLSGKQKVAFYESEGVLAVLQCPSGWMGAVRGFGRPGTKDDNWSLEGSLASLPLIVITPEHYNRMVRILKRDIPVRVELEVRNRLGEKVQKAHNVIGEIPGTDLKDEIVMLGAHFDTWHASPNAADNTSGCAVSLEAARILLALGVQPRRTIRVALWGGEEQGIHGSREYVHKHFGNPHDDKVGVKPGYDKFSVYFNQDYGAGAYRGIWLQENEHARRYFAAWMKPLRDLGFTAISIRGVGSTDHVAFDRAGLPGFQFIQDRIPGTGGHTNLDFFDTLQPEDLMKNAVIQAIFAYHAAMIDSRIPRKPMK